MANALADSIMSCEIFFESSSLSTNTRFFKRSHFINNLVLDSLTFKKLLELHGKSQETSDKQHNELVTCSNAKLYRNNVNITLLQNKLAQAHFVCYKTNSLLHSCSAYAITAVQLPELKNLSETFRTKLWSEIKKLLVLGLELGFLYKKNVHITYYITFAQDLFYLLLGKNQPSTLFFYKNTSHDGKLRTNEEQC